MKQFKAESKRLLDLMINSIYTHKEIFLRELISNASDALDKLCYLSLTDEGIGLNRSDFAIDISADSDARTLTISDNGIGMTAEEMENNLGTIARSGSKQFKDSLQPSENDAHAGIDIIGQFGVGFYSAFMVADEVTVISRAHGADGAHAWHSKGVDGYTIKPAEREHAGTDVIIKLKPDTDDEKYSSYLQQYVVEDLVKRFSDYIRFPIRMEKEVYEPTQDGDEKAEPIARYEIVTLNSMVPVWQKSTSDLADDDYDSFYREKFYDFEQPMCHIHVDAEGAVRYKALLFIPSKASYDYFTKDYKKGLQLYSSGVLIQDSCEDLLPDHFRFVRGVVDSPDLSLNISREMLQHSRELKVIAGNIEKKIKSELTKLLENDREKYETFYKQFGIQLKYGVASDYGRHKDLLQDLLLFPSSQGDGMTTLADYAGRMPEDQKYIYYATGDSTARIANLPQTEVLRERGYEILYFTDEVDEFAAASMRAYQEKEFKSANKDDLGLLSDEEKKAAEEKAADAKDLLSFVQQTLGDRVKEVRLSAQLKKYPACLTAAGGISFEMERYLSAFNTESGAKAARVFELNPDHRLYARIESLYSADREQAERYIEILYTQALMMAGLQIDDPAAYSELLFGMLE